jgi:hypothetical protein
LTSTLARRTGDFDEGKGFDHGTPEFLFEVPFAFS